MSKYKMKVLLALDGSDQSFEAARYVSQFFLPKRLNLVLFQVRRKSPNVFTISRKTQDGNMRWPP